MAFCIFRNLGSHMPFQYLGVALAAFLQTNLNPATVLLPFCEYGIWKEKYADTDDETLSSAILNILLNLAVNQEMREHIEDMMERDFLGE